MLFGRGVWSVFGVRKASLENISALNDPVKLFQLSQLLAVARAKHGQIASFGINPYSDPRKDEASVGVPDASFLDKDTCPGADAILEFASGFGSDITDFSLGDGRYAFWLVINDFEDVTDPKSKQEALAYKDAGRPFKFLSKDEKKLIEANVNASAVYSRVQFPVLLDINAELVFVASGNAEQVGLARGVVEALGGEAFSLAWQFGGYDWPALFLRRIEKRMNADYRQSMRERAEELSRFRAEEVEKLDDKMMESVVSTFFALAELDTGLWAGLKPPARIRLFHSGDPASVATPSVGFSLLENFDNSEIAAASVVFQSLDTKFNKKGEERQVRTDLFSIDVNDNVNLLDAGAAMLRGFDLPRFKKELKQAAKNSGGSLTISDYWKEWLSAMKTAINTFVENVTETLEIDKKKFGLKPFEQEAPEAQNG